VQIGGPKGGEDISDPSHVVFWIHVPSLTAASAVVPPQPS